MHKAVDNLLAIGFVLRLSRVVTTDWVGFWWLREPARKWALKAEDRAERWEHSAHRAKVAAMGREHSPVPVPPKPPMSERGLPDDPRTWQAKLAKGLDCPFCVGFWLGAAVLLSLAIARAVPPLLPVWRAVATVFSLNYLTGHIGARLD